MAHILRYSENIYRGGKKIMEEIMEEIIYHGGKKTSTLFRGPNGANICNSVKMLILYVTLEHKTSLKSLRCICSNNQKYIVWVKIMDFILCQKS